MIDSLSGKVLRLDPLTGNGVPSNPYYDAANPRAHRSRVWALGLRNPFRMTLRPGTGSRNPADGNPGEFTLGDVGYDTWEETDVVTGPRQNFGWPIFEGLEPAASYSGLNPVNPDAPNPLFGTPGCTQPFFRFRDLIVQATLATPSWPNPCNAGVQIPAATPRFMHTRPLMDWRHGSGPSRTGSFSGTTATVANIGAAGSPLMGPQFGGNCSIGGSFYLGTNFPSTYQNSYFFADLGERLDQEPDLRREQPADRRARFCHGPRGRGAHGRAPDHREAVLRALLRRLVQGRLCRDRESAAHRGGDGEHAVRAEPVGRAVHRQRLVGSGRAPAQATCGISTTGRRSPRARRPIRRTRSPPPQACPPATT